MNIAANLHKKSGKCRIVFLLCSILIAKANLVLEGVQRSKNRWRRDKGH